MKVLIIEDEVLAQEELMRILSRHFPEMKIVAVLESVKEAIAWFETNIADLVFMDVQLADGLCSDIFDNVEVQSPIIFTTAYDQYAVRAFKVNGIGYLLKPIVVDDLVQAVKKLEVKPDVLRRFLDNLKPRGYKNRIVVKSGDRISFVSVDEVAYFYSDEGMTFACTFQGRKQFVDYTIEALEPLLNPRDFFRITRGCIVSIKGVGNVTKYFGSRLKVTLKPDLGQALFVSRVRVPDFIRWLDDE